MSRFKKRPVIVEAERFTQDHILGKLPLPNGVTKHPGPNPQVVGGAGVLFSVTTAHGQEAYLEEGDWIIAEPGDRGHYPCKPDIFSATYEPAEAA